MKRLYWRPAGASSRAMAALACIAIIGIVSVELFETQIKQEDYEAKLKAAQLAQVAFSKIAEERVRRGHPINPRLDPARTGMIGAQATLVTTSGGDITAKRTAANPNFAAVIVDMLKRIPVEEGDVVAVGFSGSFPSMNVAVMSAIEVLGLKPIIIASAAASDYGANLPDFLWLDMERVLVDEGLFETRSMAASLGGIEDRGLGMTDEGRELVMRGIERNGVQFLASESFEDAIGRRMDLFDAASAGRPLRAYINVGGGAVSVGRSRGKHIYRAGINRPLPQAPVDSVIGRFLGRGVPVLHLVRIKGLAEEYGLPFDSPLPQTAGVGGVFSATEPNRPLAAGFFVLLVAATVYVGRRARARAPLKTLPPPSNI